MKNASRLAITAISAAIVHSFFFTARAAETPDSNEDWRRDVAVCTGGASGREVVPAKSRAESIFRPIGVRIHWQSLKRCPPGAIQIRFGGDTKPSFFPGALAYARPYEGTHVVVFLDRIQRSIESSLVPALLAHVMVHEITHILQGLSRHSEAGIMKARWEAAEHAVMGWKTLPFAAEDVELIRHAFKRKETPLARLALSIAVPFAP